MFSPKVCVVIVTYNGIKWIDKCLSSIEKSSTKADILIIDNGSTDGTLEILRQKGRCTHLHESEANLGFGKANNIGLKHGFNEGYDYFLLLNQDAWVEENTIEHLIVQMESESKFGITSPMHYNGNGTKLDHFFEFYLSRMDVYQEDLKKDQVKEQLYEAPFINAACWMVNRSTLEKVGLFHPLFDHYGEDDNYLDRLHHSGLKLGLDTQVKIYHDRDTEAVNHLKDDPTRLFKRSILRALLNPQIEEPRKEASQLARTLSKRLSKKFSGISKLFFRIKCMLEFYRLSQKVRRFTENQESQLSIQ